MHSPIGMIYEKPNNLMYLTQCRWQVSPGIKTFHRQWPGYGLLHLQPGVIPESGTRRTMQQSTARATVSLRQNRWLGPSHNGIKASFSKKSHQRICQLSAMQSQGYPGGEPS